MKLTASEGKDFEVTPAGTMAARCIRVVDLGTQETEWEGVVKLKRQLCISWELAEFMEDGKPFCIQKIFTATIGDKSNLGKLLIAWRGKDFTATERAGFEIENILNVVGLMSVENYTSKKGDIKERVGGIIPMPKGMTDPERVNELFKFDIDEIDQADKLEKLWGLEKFIMAKSEEFKLAGLTMPESNTQVPNTAENDETMPF